MGSIKTPPAQKNIFKRRFGAFCTWVTKATGSSSAIFINRGETNGNKKVLQQTFEHYQRRRFNF